MDRIFEIIDCIQIEKRRLAIFQLTYAAVDWWDTVKGTIGEDTIRELSWTTFKQVFLEKYFLETEKDKRERAFIDLVQGNMMVREYTTQFERLSRFPPYMVVTQEK